MNQKAEKIKREYMDKFRVGFDHFLQMKQRLNYNELQQYKAMMARLALLVELWGTVDRLLQPKEKKNG